MNRPRAIIHLDLDAFYASVEQLDRPPLRGQPVIVGGTGGRGVVAAASYEARRFGIRSAMPMSRALRLCPQAVVQPVRMARYRELSAQVADIFRRYTDRIEPLSLDEAFLDVTGSRLLFGAAGAIAARIRAEVRGETGLTISAGVATNKFLAKLASEAAKPDGLMEIEPAVMDAFLLPLPVERLWGIGQRATERLQRYGIRTVADLRRCSADWLQRQFGSAGLQWFRLCRGEDEREVETAEAVKSVGHEDTYAVDLTDAEAMQRALLDLAERVAARVRRQGLQGRCLTLKIRYADFETHTRRLTLPGWSDHAGDLYQASLELLSRTEAASRPVRLLGLSLADWCQEGETLALFEAPVVASRQRLDQAVDVLRKRFGRDRVVRGSLLRQEE